MERASVLLVDEGELFSKSVAAELSRHYRLRCVAELVPSELEGIDVLVLPYEVAAQVSGTARKDSGPRVIAVAPRPMIGDLVRAMQVGVHDVVLDANDVSALCRAISDAAEQRRILLDLSRFQRKVPRPEVFSNLLGESPAMFALRDRLGRIASSHATTLISGPRGSGKQLVARALHDAGPRRTAPFTVVAADSALMPQHAGGTLLIEEVSELSPAAQAGLIRLLDERGVRVLATSSGELEREVSAGRFREDLYRRLAAAYVRVPALNERDHDILLLAQHFIARHSRGTVSGLTPAAAQALLAHAWPGNVRELERCVVSALDTTRADHLGEADLPRQIRRQPAPVTSPLALESLDAVERKHIVKTLRSVDGNKALAARILELDRKTLFRKLQAYEKTERSSEPPSSSKPPPRPRSDSIPG